MDLARRRRLGLGLVLALALAAFGLFGGASESREELALELGPGRDSIDSELPEMETPGPDEEDAAKGTETSADRESVFSRPHASRVGDLLQSPVRGRVRLAGSGKPVPGVQFWVEQEELWNSDSAMTLVETDSQGEFTLPLGYRHALVSIGRAWNDESGSDPIYELEPRRVQLVEGADLELTAKGPELTLVVRGRLSDGTYVQKPRISLIESRSRDLETWRADDLRTSAYFDKTRMPPRMWGNSTEEQSVFRLFPSDFRMPHLRAVFRGHSSPAPKPSRGRNSSSGTARFDTDVPLSLDGLKGEVHHTFLLKPRPRLSVRLLNEEGVFTPEGLGSEITPLGVEAYAYFQSGDLVQARLDRARTRWLFDSGWIVPGPCEVRLVDPREQEILASRSIELHPDEERELDFQLRELQQPSSMAEAVDGRRRTVVSGRVLDSDDEGVSRVEIHVEWEGGSASVFSGEKGEFGVYRACPADAKVRLHIAEDVWEGCFEPSEMEVVAGTQDVRILRQPSESVELALHFVDAATGETILGLRHCVLYRGGRLPRADPNVELIAPDWDSPLLTTEVSRGIEIDWVAHAPHYRPARGRVALSSPSDHADLRIELSRGFQFDLQLVDRETRNPVRAALVTTLAGLELGETDEKGLLHLDRRQWPEGLKIESSAHETYDLRLDWDGLSEHWNGRVELRRRP